MVKECLVILNNEAITVVRYDGTDIQFPSINKNVDTVFVNYEGGKYFIVDKDYKPNFAEKANVKKGANKKTTDKDNVEATIEKTSITEDEEA